MSNLEERIWKIEARQEIQEIHNKYAHGMIQGNEDIFMSFWDEDAIWDMGSFGTAVGYEEIRTLWKRLVEKKPTPNPMMVNTIVNFTNEGVEAICNNFAVSSSTEGKGKVTFCVYYDKFVQKDEKWYLARRRFEPLYIASLNDIVFSK